MALEATITCLQPEGHEKEDFTSLTRVHIYLSFLPPSGCSSVTDDVNGITRKRPELQLLL